MTSSEARDWLMAQLPKQQQSLMEAIEQRQRRGLTVELRQDEASPTDPNPDAPACFMSRIGGVIQLRNWKPIELNAITHELLHLERYIMHSIPQLVPRTSQRELWQITSNIENSLEHLTIVPLEREFGFDPAPYWKKTYQANWEGFSTENFNEFAVKKNVLLGYTTLPLAEDRLLEDQVEKIIDQLGLLEMATEFRRQMVELSADKARQLTYVCRSLGIPLSDVALQRYFPGNWNKRSALPKI